MPNYSVECACGSRTKVELFQCGLDVPCSKCRQPVHVPSSTKLQQAAGERFPNMSGVDRIRQSILDRVAPFDGNCAACSKPANHQVNFRFIELVERVVDDDQNGFRVSPLGISARVAASQDTLRQIDIPLCLCDACSEEFQQSRSRVDHRVWQWLMVAGIFGAVFQLIFRSWPITLVLVAVALGMFARFRSAKTGDQSSIPPWSRKWIDLIPHFPETIQAAMEPRVTVGKPTAISRN